MRARAWVLPLVLIAVPMAAATYGEGGQIEADPPVTLEGRVDTWLPAGTATYVGSAPTQLAGFQLTADEATLIFRTVAPSCAGFGIPGAPCSPGPPEVVDETLHLTGASIVATKPLSSFKIVATTDRTHADTPSFGDDGRILVTTASATRLGTNHEAVHLSMSDGDWIADSDSTDVHEPVYAAEAYSAELTASTAVLRATGGFEAFFQGIQVTVTGFDDKGEKVSKTYDTRMPSDESDPYRAVLVEVSDGDMRGSSAAPFVGYAPGDQRPISDVHTRANFAGATGTVAYADRGDDDVADEDLSLAGPLSLTLTTITSGSTPRIAFAIVDGLQLANVEDLPRDDPIPPAALAAASAAGAGGAGALIALAYFWPRLKFWATLMLLPMYTRIERDAVLEHEKRDELYELIRATPGIHAHEIGEKANIGWGTTVYHLKLLENHGLIVSKKSGRYKRFFVNTGEYTKKKDIYGALRNETAKTVAQYIVDHPGTTQKELCAALAIQPSLASWHVEKLEGVELVKRVKDGRMVRYFAGPAWSELNVRVNPLAGGADTPVET